MSSSPGKAWRIQLHFNVPAERCSGKRVCHKLLLPVLSQAVQSPGLKLHRSKSGMTITRRRFWLLSLSCNFSVPKYVMYSSRSFKLSCMDGQVDYPGVRGNVGQTLSCPSEKDCEPSHAKTCLLATEGSPEFAEGAAFSNQSSLVSNQ